MHKYHELMLTIFFRFPIDLQSH